MESKQNLNEVPKRPYLTAIDGDTYEERAKRYREYFGHDPKPIPISFVGKTPEDFECVECKECKGVTNGK